MVYAVGGILLLVGIVLYAALEKSSHLELRHDEQHLKPRTTITQGELKGKTSARSKLEITSEIVNFVRLNVERKGYVVPNELEARVNLEMLYVSFGSGEKVVDAENFMSLL